MKNIFAIIIAGLLTGCVTTDLYTPPEKISKSKTPKVNYAKAKLITDQKILHTGLNQFNDQSIKKLFPILGHPASSFDVGDETSYKYIFRENYQSTAYTTYYNYFATTSVTTSQSELTISFLTDSNGIISEYYISGNSNFYITSLAYKFIKLYPLSCVKDGKSLTKMEIKYSRRNTGLIRPKLKEKILYYCEAPNCNYAIKFTPYMTYLMEKNN
ncbi:MAG: hypothetical protein CMF27_05885 [Kiritimatiellaceae bacterium]|nr:hypothetical protein [Kiritimatiellaceae bacterium]